MITTFVREDGGGFLFVFDDENWCSIDRSSSHSTSYMDMIQVCCQSWFIFTQADGENYAEMRGEMHDEIDGETDGEA